MDNADKIHEEYRTHFINLPTELMMEKTYLELCTEIEHLQREAEAARKRESSAALAEVRRLIAQFNFSAAECGFSGARRGGEVKRKAAKVKYRHPENAALTWTGRGKPPKWLTELETQGKRRDSFLVGA